MIVAAGPQLARERRVMYSCDHYDKKCWSTSMYVLRKSKDGVVQYRWALATFVSTI